MSDPAAGGSAQPPKGEPGGYAPSVAERFSAFQRAGGLVVPADHDPAGVPHRWPRRARHDREQPALHVPGDLQRHGPRVVLPPGQLQHRHPVHGGDRLVPTEHEQPRVARRVRPAADTSADHHADLHRPRGRLRLPLRALQHRGSGPVHRGLARGGLGRVVVREHGPVPARRPGHRGRRARRCVPRGNRRLPEGDGGCARGGGHDHAELDHVLDGPMAARLGRSPERRTSQRSTSEDVADSGKLPTFWGLGVLQGAHVGLFLGIAALVVYAIVLNRTTLGYEVRAVGHSPDAARYGGISVARSYFLAMAIAGAFAGIGGAMDVLGWEYRRRSEHDLAVYDRVPRDRRRPPRPEHRDRHGPRGSPLRAPYSRERPSATSTRRSSSQSSRAT